VIERLHQTAVGIGAAVRTPAWLRDERLRRLVDGVEQSIPPQLVPHHALRAARVTLRALGRAPLLPWRNTCLFRSIAECLVLRRFGIACRLRVGVRHAGDVSTAIEAHAWVEWSGQPDQDSTHVILHPSG
jgi:hypothetical protein